MPKDYPDLTGKITLVTGSNVGIGYETAKALLKQNATVIFFNRNLKKSKAAVERIQKELGSNLDDRIILITADLGDLTSIKPAMEELKAKGIEKLHYTILNAGVMQPPNG